MGTFPKRRKSKYNPYTLGYDETKKVYTVTFKNVNNNLQTVEINELLYKEFNKFELQDLSEMNEYDNHIEHSELYENTLYKKSFIKEKSIEEIVEYKMTIEQLKKIVGELSIIQRSRVIRYFIENKTYEEIAREDGCTKRAIKFSVDIAISKLLKKFKN